MVIYILLYLIIFFILILLDPFVVSDTVYYTMWPLYCKQYSFSHLRSVVLGVEDIFNNIKPLTLWSSHSNWERQKTNNFKTVYQMVFSGTKKNKASQER